MSKIPKYQLYYTLCANLSDDDLTAAQKKSLCKKIAAMDDDRKKAIILLITEHAIINDEYKPSKKTKLPYGGQQFDTNFSIDIDALPIHLRWILWKFKDLNPTENS